MTDETCGLHGIRRCTICLVSGPVLAGPLCEVVMPEVPAGFRPVGHLAPGQDIAWSFDEDKSRLAWGRVLAEMPGLHVAECQDCPTTPDPQYGGKIKREWVFDSGAAAEAAAELHHLFTRHHVKLLHRQTFTVRQVSVEPLWYLLTSLTADDPWGELIRLGDCGDVERSLT